jgi:short-subunit dehydrogenase
MNTHYTLITGASSGIGLALARHFASKKHNLILVARREEKLKEIAAELESNGIKVEVITADLANSEGAAALYQKTKDAKLTIDILVNNAGRGHLGEFVEQDLAYMKGTMELNMISLTVLSRLFLEDMKQRKQGHILNVASIAGFIPGPGFALYHATKAFVLSLSEALNTELAGSGVSVTASCPGPTESEFHQLAETDSLKSAKLIQYMTAEQVADEAYKAMKGGKAIVIHGLLNQALAAMPKFMPRKLATGIASTVLAKR